MFFMELLGTCGAHDAMRGRVEHVGCTLPRLLLGNPGTRRSTARNARRVRRMAHELVWARRGAPQKTVLAWSRVPEGAVRANGGSASVAPTSRGLTWSPPNHCPPKNDSPGHHDPRSGWPTYHGTPATQLAAHDITSAAKAARPAPSTKRPRVPRDGLDHISHTDHWDSGGTRVLHNRIWDLDRTMEPYTSTGRTSISRLSYGPRDDQRLVA